ncbi:MAG: tRNA pseudouridine(55) synthase TruB [Ignavibacteria bacterium]|nr:tRNA pseudouridine(55) synthase TruB [Ignavibacteria bacterium]
MEEQVNKYTDCVILVDKPINWTSAKVINKMKKVLNIKKAGHSGTLDPRATGLLIVCTGKKTKIITDIIGADKDYEGSFRIGAVTPTYDTESEEINITDTSSVSNEMIETACGKFQGEILQTPPIHSAIKQNGRPVYKLARKGRTVELEARKVKVNKFTVNRLSETEVGFFASVTKGTYIRSLANDFGKEIGVGAYLKTLRRTRIGQFDISVLENNFEELEGMKFSILENF